MTEKRFNLRFSSINNNIAVGTAKGRIRSKFNELKEEANQYGFNLVDFIEEAGLNSDYFE